MYRYKRNGFTLVELMAVIIIISLIALLTFPNIINQIKKTKKSNNKMIEDVIIEQAKKYVSDYKDEFQDDDGYCLSIDTLVDKGYVNEQLVGINNKDNDVIMMIKQGDFSYKIVNKNDCDVSEYQNIFVDNEGKKYTRVEYLESTGTQWIDSGVQSSSDVKFDIDFIATDYNDNPLIGGRADNYTNNILFTVYDNGGTYKTYVRFSSASLITIGNLYINQQYNVKYSKDGIYIDEQKVHNGFADVFKDNGYGMSVFGIRNTTTGNMLRYGKLKLYKLKIYDGDSLVRYYIPVLDKNGVACLYDKVEKKYYYNQGTGDFLYG